jgi:hypothetical protein
MVLKWFRLNGGHERVVISPVDRNAFFLADALDFRFIRSSKDLGPALHTSDVKGKERA